MVKPGVYKHYKGGVYKVLFTASHSDTGEPMVVYMNEEHGTYYVRPLSEFTSNVTQGTETYPRFLLLE